MQRMTLQETQLAADLLDYTADRFADEQRRDWNLPGGWSDQQRTQFLTALHAWNGSPMDPHPRPHIIAGFLAHRLKQ